MLKEVSNMKIWKQQTYIKGNKSAIIDLTFVDPKLMVDGYRWCINNNYIGNDHQPLVYKVHTTKKKPD